MLQQLIHGGLETALNHVIARTPKIDQSLRKLKGKVLGLKLQSRDLGCYLVFSHQRIDILQHYEGECDCQVEAAARLLWQFPKKSQISQYLNDKSIILHGDLQVLQDFVAMTEELQTDPAELLSPYMGDVLAQSAVDFAKKSFGFVQKRAATSQRYWGERLTEEWQLISPRLALADFADQVKTLEKQTALFAEKLAKFQSDHATK